MPWGGAARMFVHLTAEGWARGARRLKLEQPMWLEKVVIPAAAPGRNLGAPHKRAASAVKRNNAAPHLRPARGRPCVLA